jgi:hypothetical protein
MGFCFSHFCQQMGDREPPAPEPILSESCADSKLGKSLRSLFKPGNRRPLEPNWIRALLNWQVVENGGRCRIRTCDFHRVKVALYR